MLGQNTKTGRRWQTEKVIFVLPSSGFRSNVPKYKSIYLGFAAVAVALAGREL